MATTRHTCQQATEPLLSSLEAGGEQHQQQKSPKITTDPFMAAGDEETQVGGEYNLTARDYGTAAKNCSIAYYPGFYKSAKGSQGQSHEKLTRFCAKMRSKVTIKTIGVVLFLLASLFCLYKIWVLTQSRSNAPSAITNELKVVNIFFRHGDRAPSDRLPTHDPHKHLVDHLWPSGLNELTDLGRYRLYRLGLETRRAYDNFLGFNSSNIAAYSSPQERCVESMDYILRGLYENQWPKNRQRSILTRYRPSQCAQADISTSGAKLNEPKCIYVLPEGTGYGDEWKRVEIDTKSVPWLFYEALNSCKYRLDHPSPVDKNLTISPSIRALVGVERLRDVILGRFNIPLNMTVLALWSTISSELNLVLTRSSVSLKSEIADWIGQVVSNRFKSIITLYDVHEQLTLLGYRDRLQDEAEYIQSGTILTSVIESQLHALDRNKDKQTWLWPEERYAGKKMLLYTSHDSIMQRVLFSLGVIHMDPANFEQRFAKWYKSDDEWAKFLVGLKMSSYGMSFRVELWELTFDLESSREAKTISSKRKSLPYVQVSLYNREDARFQEVDYKPVDIGTACMRLFVTKYGKQALDELSQFYDPELDGSLDKRRSCPFDLWLNVTADLRVSRHRLLELCPEKKSGETDRETEPTTATSSGSAKLTKQLPDLALRRK